MEALIHRWRDLFRLCLQAESLTVSKQRLILALILLSVLLVRLLTIGAPALDRTRWKEIDYLMISTNFAENNFNFFRPELSWPAEPPRVTEMEFPLVPFAAALIYQPLGFNVYSARLVTLAAFLLLIIYVFRLCRRELGPLVGVAAAFAAGMIPLYHPFGRILFTEPLMIAMSVVTLFYTAELVDRENVRSLILASVALSLTIALKLEALYLLLPVMWLGFRKYGWQWRRYGWIATLIASASVLPVAWYSYAYYLELAGVHAFGIFRGHNKFQTLAMLSEPSWYRALGRRVFYEILGGAVGTGLVMIGLAVGFWRKQARAFSVYLVAIGIYFILVAEGQFDAPYRQMTAIPPLAVFMALGSISILVAIVALAEVLGSQWPKSSTQARAALVGALALLSLVPVARHREIDVRGEAAIPSHADRWEAAELITSLVAPESKLIVAGEYSIHVGGNDVSPVLYHYTGLQGWTLQPGDWREGYVRELIGRGATHLVALRVYGLPRDESLLGDDRGSKFLDEIETSYRVLFKGSDLLVVDLTSPPD